ncbi:MAG: hypothetical protein GX790_03970 [Syntrophomonadaceae bacterium]|nr:hypothetical protein [Syntrophomonadaceae bacterium]
MNQLPQRKRLRLKDYDYSQSGYYFITICTHGKRKILCDIVGEDSLVIPSAIGKIVSDCWNNISKLNDTIKTDLFCLMPNHIHGIIIIENSNQNIKINKKFGFETA